MGYVPIRERLPRRRRGGAVVCELFSPGLWRNSQHWRRLLVPWLQRFVRYLMRALALLMILAVMACVAIRLTVRDMDTAYIWMIHYATPWSVLGYASMTAGLMLILSDQRTLHRPGRWHRGKTLRWPVRWGRRAVLGGILLLVISHLSHFRPGSTAALSNRGPTVDVMTWNIEMGRWAPQTIADALGTRDADIVAILEPGRTQMVKRWQEALADHEFSRTYGDILLASRYPILQTQPVWLSGRSRSLWVTVEHPQVGPVQCVVVDMTSEPWFSKRSALALLLERIKAHQRAHPVQPMVILGDFNVPTDSKWLDDWRQQGLVNAFEQSGKGYAHTWPMPWPMLSIDQIWLGGPVRAVTVQTDYTIGSDHLPMHGRLQFTGNKKADE